jgi:hypothetical protein
VRTCDFGVSTDVIVRVGFVEALAVEKSMKRPRMKAAIRITDHVIT